MTKVSALCNFNCTSSNHTIEDSELHLGRQDRINSAYHPNYFYLSIDRSAQHLGDLAVKKRPRLQSKPNILLACLAATDAFNWPHNTTSLYPVRNI